MVTGVTYPSEYVLRILKVNACKEMLIAVSRINSRPRLCKSFILRAKFAGRPFSLHSTRWQIPHTDKVSISHSLSTQSTPLLNSILDHWMWSCQRVLHPEALCLYFWLQAPLIVYAKHLKLIHLQQLKLGVHYRQGVGCQRISWLNFREKWPIRNQTRNHFLSTMSQQDLDTLFPLPSTSKFPLVPSPWPGITPESTEKVTELLKQNHVNFHCFFNYDGFHKLVYLYWFNFRHLYPL